MTTLPTPQQVDAWLMAHGWHCRKRGAYYAEYENGWKNVVVPLWTESTYFPRQMQTAVDIIAGASGVGCAKLVLEMAAL